MLQVPSFKNSKKFFTWATAIFKIEKKKKIKEKRFYFFNDNYSDMAILGIYIFATYSGLHDSSKFSYLGSNLRVIQPLSMQAYKNLNNSMFSFV